MYYTINSGRDKVRLAGYSLFATDQYHCLPLERIPNFSRVINAKVIIIYNLC